MLHSVVLLIIVLLCSRYIVNGRLSDKELMNLKFRSLDSAVFMGHKQSAKEWIQVKYNANCWTRHGHWVINKSIGYQFDKSMNYVTNYNRASPCQLYNEGTICNQALEGDSRHYQWIPSQKCQNDIDFFSIKSFCSLNMTGNIMIVGDSMSELLAKVWSNEIAVQSNINTCSDHHEHRKTYINCSASSGKMNTTIHSFRNDRLTLTNRTLVDHSRNIYEMSWVPLLSELHISLLVLNRGAHYVDDSTLTSEISATLEFLRTHHPHIGVIWRNTPYGHVNYAPHFLDPPLSVPDSGDLTSAPAGYHYREIYRQNALVKQLLHVHFPEVLYLDVATATVLRRDSHLDPLHYCVLGPVLLWVHLIFNVVLAIVKFPRVHEF